MSPKSTVLALLEDIFLHSWWVILFTLLCYMWLEHEQASQMDTFQILSTKLQELKKQKTDAVHTSQRLKNQINSQSDPAWVELTLMKGIGLVPNNQQKIYFTDD